MAPWHSTNNRSSLPPPTFIPTTHSPQPCLGTMDTKGWGCYSDRRSILPLAGPGSPCTIVNHLPNNEPYFKPSPPWSSPVFSLAGASGTFSPPMNTLITLVWKCLLRLCLYATLLSHPSYNTFPSLWRSLQKRHIKILMMLQIVFSISLWDPPIMSHYGLKVQTVNSLSLAAAFSDPSLLGNLSQ